MSHDPHASHTPHGHDHEESLSKTLARMQFVVTGIFIVVIASLAYIAGMHSAKGGHGEGEGGGTSAAPASKVDVQALLKDSPEQIAKGKSLFAVNCASCHGNTGQGNGPAAAALNPKPRDFTSGYWRYGGGEARVVRTISEGSPGTAMAAFTGIPLEDRFALAHYVRSLGPKEEQDKPEDLAWLGPTGGTSEAGGAAAAGGPATPQPSKATMSIEQAIALLAQPEPKAGVAMAASSDTGEPGAALYGERCASCHGGAGEGGVRVRMIGSAPYAYVESRSLGDAQGAWTGDGGAFEKLILNGIPGYVMPANGDLSREELQNLRGYTLKLRALQQGARRTGS